MRWSLIILLTAALIIVAPYLFGTASDFPFDVIPFPMEGLDCKWVAVIIILYEVAIRAIPTRFDATLLSAVKKLFDWIFPDRRKSIN